MICPSCSAEMPDTAHFCGNCRSDLTGSGDTAGSPKPRSLGAAAAGDGQALQPVGPIPAPGDLVSQGLEAFKPAAVPFIVCMVITAVVSMIPLLNLATLVLMPGLTILALRAASGRPVEIGHFFGTFKKLVPILLCTLIVGLATGIAGIIPVIGSLVVGTLLQYSLYFVIDRDMEFVEAIKMSVNVVKGDFVPHLILALVCGVVMFVGMLLLGIGALITVPLAACMHAVAYQKQFGIQGGVDKLV